jgi:polyisoprenoid-binding protein YceI
MTTATLNRPWTPGIAVTTLQPGTWTIDPNRAVVAFSGKASFMTPTISARFLTVGGSVDVEQTARGLDGSVDVAVDVTSMTTGNAVWDEVISSFDPFDASRFPVAVYRSTGVQWSAGKATIDGSLTLRGVTRPLPLTASYDVGRSGSRMLVRAAGSLDRSAFGVNFDVPGCGKLVPKVMRLEIDVDVVLSTAR